MMRSPLSSTGRCSLRRNARDGSRKTHTARKAAAEAVKPLMGMDHIDLSRAKALGLVGEEAHKAELARRRESSGGSGGLQSLPGGRGLNTGGASIGGYLPCPTVESESI